MKAAVKKILSLLLCLALLAGLPVAGAQAAGKACACSNVPHIFVRGIGGPLYRGYGTSRQAQVPPGAGLPRQILPIAKDLAACLVTQDPDRGADAVVKVFYGLLGDWRLDEKGKSVQPITAGYAFDKAQDHKANRKYAFDYDWRMDPMRTARQLDELIRKVKAATGHGKVVLQCYSQGGVVATAYLAQFGHGDIDHLILTMSAHCGLTAAGELAMGKLDIDGSLLAEYLRRIGVANNEGVQALILPAAHLLKRSGLAALLTKIVGKLLPAMKDKIMKEAILPLLFHFPAFWSFVPDEYYEPAKKALLRGAKYKDFIKIIDNFHYNAGSAMAGQLLASAAKDTKVSIVAGYGFPPIPINKSRYDTDIGIDSARASAGGIVAWPGKTLPADYKQKARDGHNHLSPDHRVDASACALPEQTWFVSELMHSDNQLPALDKLVKFLMDNKKQPTVFTSKKYPQFLERLPDGSFAPAARK